MPLRGIDLLLGVQAKTHQNLLDPDRALSEVALRQAPPQPACQNFRRTMDSQFSILCQNVQVRIAIVNAQLKPHRQVVAHAVGTTILQAVPRFGSPFQRVFCLVGQTVNMLEEVENTGLARGFEMGQALVVRNLVIVLVLVHVGARNRLEFGRHHKSSLGDGLHRHVPAVEDVEVAQHDQVVRQRPLVGCVLRCPGQLAGVLGQCFAESRDFSQAPGVHCNAFAVVDVHRRQRQIGPACAKARQVGQTRHLHRLLRRVLLLGQHQLGRQAGEIHLAPVVQVGHALCIARRAQGNIRYQKIPPAAQHFLQTLERVQPVAHVLHRDQVKAAENFCNVVIRLVAAKAGLLACIELADVSSGQQQRVGRCAGWNGRRQCRPQALQTRNGALAHGGVLDLLQAGVVGHGDFLEK